MDGKLEDRKVAEFFLLFVGVRFVVVWCCGKVMVGGSAKYGYERGNNEPCNPEPASDPSRPIVPCACRFPVARRQLRPVNHRKKRGSD